MTTDDAPPLIASTARPALEQALNDKLTQRSVGHGSMGELDALAVRLGLIQGTLRPRLRQPQLLVFASDHGIAVDVTHPGELSTDALVDDILHSRVPLPVFAHAQGLHFNLVDAGLASPLPAQPGVLSRKIAHGTRNCRVAPAMSMEQVHSAIRAGMEIAQDLPGNVMACAGIGVGSHEAATLLINRLSGLRLHDLMFAGPKMDALLLEQRLVVLQAAQTRHFNIDDPVEVLAAFGGFETAMMVGAMLVAASQRRLILVDGMSACAALMVASRIGGAVGDYCVFSRSTSHRGLDTVLASFDTSALIEVGMESLDGTGVALAWPILQAAATLMSSIASDHPDPALDTAPDERLSIASEPARLTLSTPSRSNAVTDAASLFASAWPNGANAHADHNGTLLRAPSAVIDRP